MRYKVNGWETNKSEFERHLNNIEEMSLAHHINELDDLKVIRCAEYDPTLCNEENAIKPNHYRKGEIDLIESWYLRYPFNEFKTGMVMYADRYFNRDKENRVQDMEKGLYVMKRLKEYEIRELEKDNEA